MAVKKSDKVVINDIHDARTWGAKVGIPFPDGRGRPPMKALLEKLRELGMEITPTEYFSGEWAPRVPAAEPGKAVYEVSHAVTKRVMREVTGKGGKVRKVPTKEIESVREKHRLNVATIRELSKNQGVRGRISESAVKEAFAKHLGIPENELVDVQVSRVVDGIEPEMRPVKASKPAKAAKEEETTPEEVEAATEDSDASELVDA